MVNHLSWINSLPSLSVFILERGGEPATELQFSVTVLTISLFSGFCAHRVAAPTFRLVQMRRNLPSEKTRWLPVFSMSQRTPMLIEGTTHQVHSASSTKMCLSCADPTYIDRWCALSGIKSMITCDGFLSQCSLPSQASQNLRQLNTQTKCTKVKFSFCRGYCSASQNMLRCPNDSLFLFQS